MSIDIMDFLKQWKRILLLLIFLGLGLFFFLGEKTSLSGTTRYQELSPTLGRIAEKIPEHPYILWQRQLQSFSSRQHTAHTQIDYTLHPSLIDPERAESDQLLSGTVAITSTWNQSPITSGNNSFDILLSGHIIGIRQQDNIAQIGIYAQLAGIASKEHMYLRIETIDIVQSGNISDTLSLRHMLFKQYAGTRIRIANHEIAPVLMHISPEHLINVIEANAKRVRLLPHTPSGWTWSISGATVQLSGHRQDPRDNTLSIHIKPYDLFTTLDSTHQEDTRSLQMEQDNDYGLKFIGLVTQDIQKRKLHRTIAGEATRPGGVRTDITHEQTIHKKVVPHKTLPKQYIERSTIREQRVNE